MSQRVQKSKFEKRREERLEEPEVRKGYEDAKAEMDAMLDEIDGVLEENAEEFVKGYVQKGGQ